MKKSVIVALAAGIAISSHGSAFATAYEWLSDPRTVNHWYEAVPFTEYEISNGLATWDDAEAAAIAKGGYLVTLTTEGENNFLKGHTAFDTATFGTTTQLGYWIGASGTATSPTNYNFNWVNSEGSVATSIAGWSPSPWTNPSEPSGPLADDYPAGTPLGLHFFGWAGTYGGYNAEGWNDLPKINPYAPFLPVGGYIVEYDTEPAPTPEPATMLLLGGGIAGLAGFRFWRRRGA